MDRLEEQISLILSEAGIDPDLRYNTRLADLDSLAIMEIMSLLERKVGRPIALGTFDSDTTVIEILRFGEATTQWI